ncbi:MAG: hypothetical protein K5656_10185, partial [Lachnospiraceae bacterium]|nr:hypothetical protein [Lachnospiraceae bacterium]
MSVRYNDDFQKQVVRDYISSGKSNGGKISLILSNKVLQKKLDQYICINLKRFEYHSHDNLLTVKLPICQETTHYIFSVQVLVDVQNEKSTH